MRARSPVHPHRSAQLAERAHAMRVAPSESEARLWKAINAGQLGVCFRRQVPLGGRYIADFAAPAVHLIVEVDGGYHARRRKADARRDRALERLGYRVVRVEAELVMRDLEAAVARVREGVAAGRPCVAQAAQSSRPALPKIRKCSGYPVLTTVVSRARVLRGRTVRRDRRFQRIEARSQAMRAWSGQAIPGRAQGASRAMGAPTPA